MSRNLTGLGGATLAAIFLLAPSGFSATAIPDDVAVIAFARPAGSRLQLLVRVPMAVFGDIRFPQRDAENYLDIPQVDAMLPAVAKYWLAPSLKAFEDGANLPQPQVVETRLALESDQSFASFEQALAHLNGPRMDPAANVFWRQAWLDVLFEYPTRDARSSLAIRFDLAHLGARVRTDMKFLAPEGAIRTFSYTGDPGLIRLDPKWYEAAIQFVQWGLFHFLNGSDYLLFAFCLVFPLRSFETSIPVAAAFICASSVALLASAWGLAPGGLWFQPLIETAIAASILFLALANIAEWITPAHRAALTLGFGLVYGFGFSFALNSKMQFGGNHPSVSALAFNVGAQLAFAATIAVLIPAIQLLVRFTKFEPMERFVPSVLAAHAAWHWMTDRWDRLALFRLQWPVIDTAFLAAALRWMMILVLLIGGARFLSAMARAKAERKRRVP